MITTFKVLSLLLSYPTREIAGGAPELREALAKEDLLSPKARAALEPLFRSFEEEDIYDLQEQFVFLFDRTKTLSLHLFEHVHGESRDRGQAMVNLKEVYEEKGFDFATNELPDYVPAFLEFLAVCNWEEAQGHLNSPLHIFCSLKERLLEKESPYAAIFSALESLASEKPDAKIVEEMLKVPTDNPDDLEELDRAWEDAAVEFGPSADPEEGCPKVSSILDQMKLDPATRDALAARDQGAG